MGNVCCVCSASDEGDVSLYQGVSYHRSCNHLFHQFDSSRKFAWVRRSSQTWVSDMFSGDQAVWFSLVVIVLILHGPFKRSIHLAPPSSQASKFSLAELQLSSELVGGRSWCMWSKKANDLTSLCFLKWSILCAKRFPSSILHRW